MICLFSILWQLRFVGELWLVYGQLIQILFQFSFFAFSHIVNFVLVVIATLEIRRWNIGRTTIRTLQVNVLHLRIILLVLILEILIGLHLIIDFDIIMICKLYLLLLKRLYKLYWLWNCSPILIDCTNRRWKAYFSVICYLCRIARIIILAYQAILVIFRRSGTLFDLIIFILYFFKIFRVLFLCIGLKDQLIFNHWTLIIFKILSILLRLFILITHFIFIN